MSYWENLLRGTELRRARRRVQMPYWAFLIAVFSTALLIGAQVDFRDSPALIVVPLAAGAVVFLATWLIVRALDRRTEGPGTPQRR